MSYSQTYAGRQNSQPNNTYLSVYSSSGYRYQRFDLICCSNASSSSYIGSITDPYRSTYTSNFNDLRIYRYPWNSNNGGCIRMDGYKNHYRYNSLSYNPGVYTCNIPDANGFTHSVNFALYSVNSKHYVGRL